MTSNSRRGLLAASSLITLSRSQQENQSLSSTLKEDVISPSNNRLSIWKRTLLNNTAANTRSVLPISKFHKFLNPIECETLAQSEQSQTPRTNNDYYCATKDDFNRMWNWDWDGKHPADTEGEDFMHGRNVPGKGAKKIKHTVRHIFLMRHGQYNLAEDGESELTELGRHQAKKTGEKLKQWADGLKKDKYGEIKIKWKKVTSSNLLRARQTADIVASVLNCEVSDYDPILNEGTPCLTNPSSVRPEDMVTKESLARHLSDPPRIEAAFRKYVNRKTNWKRAKRKSNEGKAKIDEGYAPEITGQDNTANVSDSDTEQQTVHEYELIICHMNVIRYFLVRALQMPPESWLRFRGDNCGLTEIIVSDTGHVSIGRFGDQGHLTIEETTFH